MKVHQFRRIKSAKKYQGQMRKAYGYTPSIFRVRNPRSKKVKFVVIKPKGLRRVRR